MRIELTEDQIARIKLKIQKENLNEDFLNDLISKGSGLIKKGVEAGKEFISGLDNDVEKKSSDDPGKADYIGNNVEKFFEILDSIDEPIKEQKYGTMTHQQDVEAVQIALQILGYPLPRFGTDGLFGKETAMAVKKFEKDNNLKSIQEASIASPISGGKLTSNFGEKRSYETHAGVDLATKSGTPVKAIMDGIVEVGDVDHNNMCGGTIDINYGNGFWSRFCHMKQINVSKGDKVTAGQVVGLSGGAAGDRGKGNSRGAHLHFTLKKDGKLVNPMDYIGRSAGEYNDPVTGYDYNFKGASMSVESIKVLTDKLKAKGITSQDLDVYVDKAITSGGSASFTDVDLTTSEGKQAYEKICSNFIQQRDPNAKVTGQMLADGAERAFKNYQKFVPPELALAQLTLEGGIASAENSRPNRTNNPFNVGNTESGSKTFSSIEAGVYAYFDLIARRYLVKGRTASDLVNDFKNDQGNNYASAGTYEAGLKTLIASIRKRNEPVYAALNKTSSSLTEDILLEADKRQAIKNAFGFNDEWAEQFHRLSDKLSVWIADTFLKEMLALSNNSGAIPEGEDPKRYLVNRLNELGPDGESLWNSRYKPNYEYILHWMRAPRREPLNVRELTYQAAYDLAQEWHESLEIKKENNYQEQGDVFIDYRDSNGVGYYWVHLHKNYCSQEADRMGHCARSNSGELISFRRVNDFGEGESYLTVDYRPGGVLGDFHRHGNKKPTERFHKQIVDFLTNTTFPVTELTRSGVHRYEDNFQLRDLSPANLARVYEGNPTLRYNINDKATHPYIVDAILSGQLRLSNYGLSNVLELLLSAKKSAPEKYNGMMDMLPENWEMVQYENTSDLTDAMRATFIAIFGDKIVQKLIADFDSERSLPFFTTQLRRISQSFFGQYQRFCPYIDHVFQQLTDAEKISTVSERGIKRTLLSCTDSIPFLERYVENTPIDKNGNISVKTEDGLWGLVKASGETILHPRFYAVAPNRFGGPGTYMVKNANDEWFTYDPSNGETVKLAKKR